MMPTRLTVIRNETYNQYSNLHISIYIPLTIEAIGSYHSRNKLRYCMSLRNVEKKILDKGFSFVKVREMLQPMEDLIDNTVWKSNCAGIVIFSKAGRVKIYSCNVPVSQSEVVGDSFYTDPLLKMKTEDYGRILFSLIDLNYMGTENIQLADKYKTSSYY